MTQKDRGGAARRRLAGAAAVLASAAGIGGVVASQQLAPPANHGVVTIVLAPWADADEAARRLEAIGGVTIGGRQGGEIWLGTPVLRAVVPDMSMLSDLRRDGALFVLDGLRF